MKPFDLCGRTIGIDRDINRVGIELAWNKGLGVWKESNYSREFQW